MGSCRGHKVPWDLGDPDSNPHPTTNSHSSRVPLITSALLADTWPEPWSYNLHVFGDFYPGSILSSGCPWCTRTAWRRMKAPVKGRERPRVPPPRVPCSSNAVPVRTVKTSAELAPGREWAWRSNIIVDIVRGVREPSSPGGVLLPCHTHPHPPPSYFEAQYKDAISLESKQKRNLVRRDLPPLTSSGFSDFVFFTLNTRFIHFP